MSDPIREAFEKWYRRHCHSEPPQHDDDGYVSYHTNEWWVAWQGCWQVAQPRWQPIETAPMDETAVLVYDANGDELATAFWDDTENRWYETSTLDVFVGQPTHWMPLPEPPKVQPAARDMSG